MNVLSSQGPAISVIITCFNQGPQVLANLSCLACQTDRRFEVLVVDDASTDPETLRIGDTLESQKKVDRVLRHEKNLGAGLARNTGIRAMTGSVCVLYEPGDGLPPAAIERVREAFRQYPDADFVVGNYVRRDVEKNSARLVDCRALFDPQGWLDPKRLVRDISFYGGSPFKKTAWLKAGGYSEKFSRAASDVEFWVRMVLSGAKGRYVDAVLYQWDRSRFGTNNNWSGRTHRDLIGALDPFFRKYGDPGSRVRARLRWAFRYWRSVAADAKRSAQAVLKKKGPPRPW